MKFEEKNAKFYNYGIEDRVKNCYIYFLMKDDEVVYVGRTTYGILRPLQHKDKDFNSFYMIECEEKDLAQKEVDMILKYQPIYNGNIDCTEDTVAITNVYKMLVKRGIKIRSIFLRYAVYRLNIDYFTFRNSFHIYKKDVEKFINYIVSHYKEFKEMQEKSLLLKFPQEPNSLYYIGNFIKLSPKGIKDAIYFNIITKQEIQEAINFINNKKITTQERISADRFFNEFPNLYGLENRYNDISIFEKFD